MIKQNKKSQVTIFIIIGVLIIAAVLLVLFLWKGPSILPSSSADPESYIDDCVKDNVKAALSLLSKQGGDIKQEGSVMYKGENWTYLCYNQNYYQPCIHQRPMLIEHIQKELTDYLKPKVEKCFTDLKSELENKDYKVTMAAMALTTELRVKSVVININRKFQISKNEESRTFKDFNARVPSPLYELVWVATEIVNDEAQYCTFNTLAFMTLNSRYDVRKEMAEDSNIYILKDLPTGKEFKFATRGCAMPPGF